MKDNRKKQHDNYFDLSTARSAKVAAYVKAQGASANDVGNGWYWLRSPGIGRSAVCVEHRGSFGVSGGRIDYEGGGVRPAFWLNPES